MREIIFKELTPMEKMRQNENCELLPLKVYPFTLKSAGLFKVKEYVSMIFCHFYKGKQLLCLPVCFSRQCSPLKIGSTLKRKNLLLREQILFFKH